MSSYEYITKHTSPNQTPANKCLKTFGYKRTIESITIHHWDDPKKRPTFDGTVNWLLRDATDASIHYVVEAGKVACLVAPKDVAWHAGNAKGNATSIGIELNPRATAGDYETAAELIRELRAAYGPLPLRPHRYWKSTSCPGDYDLSRLDALARGAVGTKTHTVTRGDTLGAIAKRYGTTVAKLLKLNVSIKDADEIGVGLKVRVK